VGPANSNLGAPAGNFNRLSPAYLPGSSQDYLGYDGMAKQSGLPNNVMGVAPGIGRRTVYVFYASVEILAERQVLSFMKGDIGRPQRTRF
jgi:hypothetical protein